MDKLYSSVEAADYISGKLTEAGYKITPRGIIFHIRKTKKLRGTMVGNVLVFSQQQLDDFVNAYPTMPRRGVKPGSHRQAR